jgi:uncharacterized protein (DUF4415 family)
MSNYANEEISLKDGRVMRGTSEWAAVDALTEEPVMAAALADSDAQPATDEQLRSARRVWDMPGKTLVEKLQALADENKQLVSVRYDSDVLAFFKAQGKGYQTLMNSVLRAYMEQKLTQEQA